MMEQMFSCDNCGKVWPESQCNDVRHLTDRLDYNKPFTDKECPKCGALCYLMEKGKPAPINFFTSPNSYAMSSLIL